MNLKRIFLFCAIVFVTIIGLLIMKSDKLSSPSINKKDPSILPPPSREFDEWRKEWEKQR